MGDLIGRDCGEGEIEWHFIIFVRFGNTGKVSVTLRPTFQIRRAGVILTRICKNLLKRGKSQHN